MKIQIELSDDEIRSILITAGEQGCGYWARTELPLVSALKQAVEVYDAQDLETHLGTLTREKLMGAAARMIDLGTRRGAGLPRPWLSDGIVSQLVRGPSEMDSDAADAFVQVALFGEIVYG